MNEVTGKVREQLHLLVDHFNDIYKKGENLKAQLRECCSELEHLIAQIAQERSLVLKSLSTVSGFIAFYLYLISKFFILSSFLPSPSLSSAHRVM